MLSTLLGAKLAAAIAAGAVSVGGVTAAAYTGALPAGVQDFAHTTVGAPAADHGKSADHGKIAAHSKSADSTKTAVGPDAKGSAAFGLCTAWAHGQTNGKAAKKSVAFRNLTTAAGGVNKIAAYCATVPHPGPSTSDKPTGHPTSKPTGKPSTHPGGKPTPLPSHSPGSSGASHRP